MVELVTKEYLDRGSVSMIHGSQIIYLLNSA